MKNKLLSAGIGFGLILILIVLVSVTRSSDKPASLSGNTHINKLIAEGRLEEAEKTIGEIKENDYDSKTWGKIYFNLASGYEESGNFVKARDFYSIILRKYQNVENISDVQEKVGKLNMDILFSNIITGRDVLYEIEPGDSLSKIAKKFGTTVDLIRKSNSLTSDVIRAHSKLKISKVKYKILIDKSQNLLTVLTEEGDIVKVYRVATGANNSSPVGEFKVINRIKDPVWYTQGAIVPAESPDNILGTRWLGISEPGYGIHGTVEPDSLGTQVTKGCIRMSNVEIEEVFSMIPIGTEVTIVD